MKGALFLSGVLLLGSSLFAKTYVLKKIEPKYPEWNDRRKEQPPQMSALASVLGGAVLSGVSAWKIDLAPWIFLATFASLLALSHIRFRRHQPPDTIVFLDQLYTAASLLGTFLIFLSMK